MYTENNDTNVYYFKTIYVIWTKKLSLSSSPVHEAVQLGSVCASPPACCRTLGQQARDAGRRLAHKNNATPQLDHIVIFTVLLVRTLKKVEPDRRDYGNYKSI